MTRAAVGVIAVLIVLAAGIGILLFGTLPPSGSVAAMFQDVIRHAPISDRYNGETGWDRFDVTEQICDKVSRDVLQQLGISTYVLSDPYFSQWELVPSRVWQVSQSKSLMSQCSDRSIRILTIEISTTTSECRAYVQPRPTCDP